MVLKKNVLKPLTKSVLIPLRLTAATASAADTRIHKIILGPAMCPCMLASHPLDLAQETTLIISNKEIHDIIEILKYLKESGLLIEIISKTIKN